MINKSYVTVVESIKEQIRCAKHKAILNVNKEMLILYWNIGKIINENSTWGSKFLKNLSIEIKREFPLTKGFSVSNLKNALGNINYIVDETGSIMVKYSYDEWGVPTKTIVQPSCPIGELNPFMYKSYYFDSDTEMYYLNSRYYYPSIRRFLTIDDISYLDYESLGNLNLYQYCNNNPIKYFDKTGKSITVPATIGIGLMVLLCLLLVVAVTYPTIDVNNPIGIPSGDVISVDNNFFSTNSKDNSIIATIMLMEVLVRLSSLVSELTSAIQSLSDKRHGHHIVAKKAWRAGLARYILVEACEITINDKRNIAQVKDIYHSHLHTNSYYGLINAGMTYSFLTNGKVGVEDFLLEVKNLLEGL